MNAPIPRQRQPELRRAADQLEARAEVAERQARGADDQQARQLRARSFELRGVAAIKRSQAAAMDASEQGHVIVTVPDPLSPDCEQRKHGACSGDAWNLVRDEPAACTCECHRATR